MSVTLHVSLSVLVSLVEQELEAHEENCFSKHEVLLGVVLAGHRVRLLLSLHETAANSAGVLVANFVDLDRVISAIE